MVLQLLAESQLGSVLPAVATPQNAGRLLGEVLAEEFKVGAARVFSRLGSPWGQGSQPGLGGPQWGWRVMGEIDSAAAGNCASLLRSAPCFVPCNPLLAALW